MKKCIACGVEKKNKDFAPNAALKGGLLSRCRPCNTEYVHRLKIKQAHRNLLKYRKTDEDYIFHAYLGKVLLFEIEHDRKYGNRKFN